MYLEQIFSRLKKNNIVKSTRGINGGYILTKNPNEVLEEGAQIVAEVKKNPPMDMLGHVTSSYFSPNLKKSIALAVIKNGKNLKGKKLYIPMKKKVIEVTVSDTVFLDKKGSRLNAWNKFTYKWK